MKTEEDRVEDLIVSYRMAIIDRDRLVRQKMELLAKIDELKGRLAENGIEE